MDFCVLGARPESISSGFATSLAAILGIFARRPTLLADLTNPNRQGKPPAWRELALGGPDVQVIAGNHYTIVREPNVEILGRQLNDRLGRIETD